MRRVAVGVAGVALAALVVSWPGVRPLAAQPRYQTSVHSIQGRRPYQEDEALVAPEDGLYAVFDGHGGGGVSHVAKTALLQHFREMSGQPLSWLVLFRRTEESYRAFDWAAHPEKRALPNHAHEGREGATAIVAHVDTRRGHITVANAGDSRCVLCQSNGAAVALSQDHKPTDAGELERLRSLGFIVHRGRIYKVKDGLVVGGGLNLSRALGDFFYGEGVPATPDVVEWGVERPRDELLVLASDGLWDVLANEEACRLARSGAVALVDHAYAKGSTDNITAIVVAL